jgi:hypothetical protein
VDSLLYEVRAWGPGRAVSRDTVDELARRFRLDPLVVHRLLESEGLTRDDAESAGPEPGATDHGGGVTRVIPPDVVEQVRRRLAGEADD